MSAAAKQSWNRKWLAHRLEKEADNLIDQARYLAVSTGRLEPYLRALAATPLWMPPSLQTVSADQLRTTENFSFNGASMQASQRPTADQQQHFIKLWSTALRCRYTSGVKTKPTTGTIVDLIDLTEIVKADRDQKQTGLLIDPDLASELVVESPHLSTIYALSQGIPVEAAFCPIGAEDLEATLPSAKQQAAALQLGEILTTHGLLPFTPRLLLIQITLLGIGGRSWPVIFFSNPHGNFLPLDLQQSQTISQVLTQLAQSNPADAEFYRSLVIVNPADPDWKRDILWRYRAQAAPVS